MTNNLRCLVCGDVHASGHDCEDVLPIFEFSDDEYSMMVNEMDKDGE